MESQIINPVLILLMGVSGVGKGAILKSIIKKDKRFSPIPIYTDRLPRKGGDFSRICVSPDVFMEMIKKGDFLVWHTIFRQRYAIPKAEINKAFAQGKIPIQDYPEEIVSDVRNLVPTFTIYILPPSLAELKQRLSRDERNNDGHRFEEGKKELKRLKQEKFKNDNIDCVILNYDLDKATQKVLKAIYSKVFN
jgi:guanylate kinase